MAIPGIEIPHIISMYSILLINVSLSPLFCTFIGWARAELPSFSKPNSVIWHRPLLEPGTRFQFDILVLVSQDSGADLISHT